MKGVGTFAGRIAKGAGLALPVVLALLGASPSAPRSRARSPLPVFGTRLAELPAGPGKEIADRACLQCHSADMLRQQHLSGKQWTSEVTKMAGWGAEVKDEEKAGLIAYLLKSFGPDAGSFTPVETRTFAKGH